jgi:hypothetical protein
VSSDIRAALERLLGAVDVYEATGMDVLDDAIAAARAALAEPVGEAEVNLELMAALIEIQRLRDLCETPATPPAPKPGEVGELVEWMRGQVTIAPAAQTQWAKRFLRIATLLSQLSAPAPVVVPVGECPHCGYEGEMARVPHAGEGEG